MAHALSLVISSTTISLSTTNNTLTDYVPRTPSGDALTVTESATVWMTAASKTALQTAVQAVEDFFGQCRRRQATNTGNRGYVKLQVDGDSTAYRSEVLDGRIVLGEDGLRHWANLGAEVLITWTRRFFWESDNLTSILIKRTGVAKTNAGLTLYNHNDSTTHENFFDIEAADIVGSLPAPLYLSFVATAAMSSRRFFVSGNVFYTPASFTAIYEGESSTAGGGALESVQADADCSNGNFMRVTWTTSIAHTRNAYVWSISAAQLAYAKGAWVRVLARLEATPPTNCYAQLKVKFDGTTPLTELWTGPEILLDSSRKLQDLGSVQLPPGYITGSPTALALILSLRHTGTSQLDLDFIQLSGPDGVHRFDQQGYQLEIGDSVVDDGINESVYILTTGGNSQHIVSDYPPGLSVWPGRDMRVRLLFDESSGMVISRTMTAYASYRPRRLTV
jgi:hypothetical protein